jgi:hypothetical protein
LAALTLTIPPRLPADAVMLFVVEVPLHPDGRFQMYDVAPATEGTEYVLTLPAHTEVDPVIADGCGGALFTVTARV